MNDHEDVVTSAAGADAVACQQSGASSRIRGEAERRGLWYTPILPLVLSSASLWPLPLTELVDVDAARCLPL